MADIEMDPKNEIRTMVFSNNGGHNTPRVRDPSVKLKKLRASYKSLSSARGKAREPKPHARSSLDKDSSTMIFTPREQAIRELIMSQIEMRKFFFHASEVATYLSMLKPLIESEPPSREIQPPSSSQITKAVSTAAQPESSQYATSPPEFSKSGQELLIHRSDLMLQVIHLLLGATAVYFFRTSK